MDGVIPDKEKSMDIFGILALTFALPAMGIAVFTQMRLDGLEKRLKAAESDRRGI